MTRAAFSVTGMVRASPKDVVPVGKRCTWSAVKLARCPANRHGAGTLWSQSIVGFEMGAVGGAGTKVDGGGGSTRATCA